MTKDIREERRKRALKTAERRKERRDKLALEKEEHLALIAKKRKGRHVFRHVFTAKGRKGDALTIRFEFSGIPIPVKDTEGTSLKRDTELARMMGKLSKSPLDH